MNNDVILEIKGLKKVFWEFRTTSRSIKRY